jgi:5-methylcytosine-specific restriction endonuclease McrA
VGLLMGGGKHDICECGQPKTVVSKTCWACMCIRKAANAIPLKQKKAASYRRSKPKERNCNECAASYVSKVAGLCPACRSAYDQKRRTGNEHLARQRAYYAKNPTAHVARVRKSYYLHAEERKEQARVRYYTIPKERLNALKRAYYAKNRAKVLTWNKAHALRKAGSLGSYTAEEWATIVSRQRGKCAHCHEEKPLTVDHVIPTSLGGSNFAYNLQGLCTPCNSRKSNRLTGKEQFSLFDRINEAALNAARTMPVIQNSMLTALGYYLSGQGKARQQSRDNARQDRQDAAASEYRQEELDMDRQAAAEKKRLDDATLQGEGFNPATGQQYPFKMPPLPLNHGTPLTPEQMVQYYLGASQQAADAQRPDRAKQNMDLATQQGLGAERLGMDRYYRDRGQELIQGKIPLEQAQAEFTRTRHPDAVRKMNLVFQAADAATRARMSAALIRARTQLKTSGMSLEARETIATMAALNAANAGGDKNALAVAMKQYDEDFKAWSSQQKQFLKTGNIPAGFDPGNPPTAETYVNNYISMPPTTTTTSVPLPNGASAQVPVVHRGQVRNLAADRKQAQDDIGLVEQARMNGIADKESILSMQKHGWSSQRIQAALKGAKQFPGGGF